MRVDRVRLKNLRQHADTEITFPESGILGLVGQNEAGKSSVLEGISWALFGSKAVRGTMDTLRWKHAPSRHIAEVTLDFAVGGVDYRLERTENDAVLRVRDGEIQAEGISAVDEEVPRVLGMDFEEFSSTYKCSQKDLSRLQEMGGTAKRQFVLSVMGMDRIDEALTDCRARKNELRTEVDGMRQGLGEREPLEEEVEEATSEVENLREKIEGELADRVGVCESELHEAEALLSESNERREKHEDIRRRGREAQREAKAAGEELERAESKLESAREAAQSFEDRRHEVADLPDLRQERDDLREARARRRERETLEGVAQGHREKLEALREREEKVVRRVQHRSDPEPEHVRMQAEERLSQARDRLDRLSEGDKVAAIRSHMEPGETCPVCEQLVTEVPDPSAAVEALREARAERDRARKAAQEATAQVEALEEARAEREQTRERFEETVSEVREVDARLRDLDVPAFDATRLAQVEGEIERVEQVEAELRELKAKADRIPELEADVERWSEKATEAKERERQAVEQIEALDFDPERHQALEERAKERREAAQEAREALSRARTRLEAAEDRLNRARSSLEAWEDRADRLYEIEADLTLHEQTAERLSDFRHAEAASIRPELEELTSAFLSLLTDGRHEAVTLTEDFDLVVQETGGEMEVISGGAEDVAAIAMRLAISQLIAERAGHPLSLLILDEPFGSLDAVRRGNVLELIRKLGGVFSQVLLITHVEEVQDSLDHVLLVEFDESRSRSVVRSPGTDLAEVA